MAKLPTGTDWTTVATEGAAKGLFTDQADNLYARLGGTPEETLTIAGGVVDTNVGGVAVSNLRVDTGGGAEDLNNVLVDLFEDGQFVLVRCENPSNPVTLKSAAGGAGQMTLVSGIDVVLNDRDQGVLFYVNKQGSAVLEEIARFNLLVTVAQDGTTRAPVGFTAPVYAIPDPLVPADYEGALAGNDLRDGVLLLGQKDKDAGYADAPVELRGSSYLFGSPGQLAFVEDTGSPLDPTSRYTLELGTQFALSDGRLARYLQVGKLIAEGGSETGTSNLDVAIPASYVEIVNVTATPNYLVPSAINYSLLLEEGAGNRSTRFEVQVRIDGVPFSTNEYTVAGAQLQVDRYVPTSATVPAGAVVSVWVQVLDTGQGRNSRVRGDVSASTVTITQIT